MPSVVGTPVISAAVHEGRTEWNCRTRIVWDRRTVVVRDRRRTKRVWRTRKVIWHRTRIRRICIGGIWRKRIDRRRCEAQIADRRIESGCGCAEKPDAQPRVPAKHVPIEALVPRPIHERVRRGGLRRGEGAERRNHRRGQRCHGDPRSLAIYPRLHGIVTCRMVRYMPSRFPSRLRSSMSPDVSACESPGSGIMPSWRV